VFSDQLEKSTLIREEEYAKGFSKLKFTLCKFFLENLIIKENKP